MAAFRKQKALVAGASGRMAAEMLSRLAFECSVADLYGDRDSYLVCEGRVTKLQSLSDLARNEQLVRDHDFVVFAGGLEGCGSLVQKLSEWSKPVFTTSQSLEYTADYRILNRAMCESNVDRYPFSQHLPMERSGRTVVKNLCKSGTARIASTEDRKQQLKDGFVSQEYIDGESISLIFVASNGVVDCLGETKQLVDPTNGLAWTGSIAGTYLDARERSSAMEFASSLVGLTGISGVLGVDFIRSGDGVWPVDVNPRIPASAEVVGDQVMRRHLVAFGIECLPVVEKDDLVWGKQVIFNRSDGPVRFGEGAIEGLRLRCSDPSSPASIADVPQSEEIIAPDHPVCTVLASGEHEEEVRLNLEALEKKILLGLRSGKH